MTEARAISDGRVDLKALIEAAKKATPGPWVIGEHTGLPTNGPSKRLGSATGGIADLLYERDATFIALANPSTVAAMAEELMALREAVKPADDPESILHALQIMSMATPYSDVQGQLYCHRPYSPDGYRDAEFRDYGLASAVRIICNNAKAIAASLQDTTHAK